MFVYNLGCHLIINHCLLNQFKLTISDEKTKPDAYRDDKLALRQCMASGWNSDLFISINPIMVA
jgi:hypothetical protein